MSSDGLLVIGSGPGIGVTTASLFAQRKFTRIALISRDKTRISKDRETILQAARSANKTIEVQTWSVDITNTTEFKTVLQETEKFATFSCVLFNAARVEPSDLLTFPEEEILKDFKVRLLTALHIHTNIFSDNNHRTLHHLSLGPPNPHLPARLLPSLVSHNKLSPPA